MDLKPRRRAAPVDVFRQFDRMFDDWLRSLPARPGWEPAALRAPEELIRVDEFIDDGTLVVKAELPGIDPDEDLRLTVDDGVLDLRAERRVTVDTEDQGYTRHELRSGTFTRRLPLPEGVDAAAVAATYKDGILTVRVPIPQPESKPEPTPVAIEKG